LVANPHHNRLEQEPPPLRQAQGACPLWNGLGRTEVGFYLLEPGIHWYDTHYVDGRPLPCVRSVTSCAACQHGWTPRRTGYISAMRGGTGGRYILRITEYAYRQCPVLAIEGLKLRGVGLVVGRRGESKQSPWRIAIDQGPPRKDLPPPVDTVAVLGMIWGIDLRHLAACPPADGDLTPLLRPFRRQKGEAS
jgi:hypothetical protein